MITRRGVALACLSAGLAGSQSRWARGQGVARTTTANDPYVIANPILGLANLIGDAANSLVTRDRADLSPLFSSVQTGTQSIPKCNVLFLYCNLDSAARISGHPFSFREAIKAAGAHVAVMASELSPETLSNREFAQGLTAKGDWPANIVITINRNGDFFGRFFRDLFSQMRAGTSMPMAWVNLAPQGPQQKSDIPATIALMEAGHIAFGTKKS
jgi:hypothetical protein